MKTKSLVRRYQYKINILCSDPSLHYNKSPHAGQNYWTLIGWDRGHFFLNHEGTFGKQEGMITWCWLAEHACVKLVSRLEQILIMNFRNASLRSLHFIVTSKKINMEQTAVFWWKSKKILPTKNALIRSLKKLWVGMAGVARSIELQNFVAAKLKVNFFVSRRVALLVLLVTLSA